MKNYADVSVVMPCYNSEKTIKRAVESVINQTLMPNEIIIVDDKSKDSSIDIINDLIILYKNTILIKLIKLENNSGPAKARNIGINNSISKYIALLDSDDSWHKQKIEIQYNFMINNPNIFLTGHKHSVLLENNLPDNTKFHNKDFSKKDINEFYILIKNWFITSSTMFKKSEIYKFKEHKKYSEDYLLWLEIIFNKEKAIYLDIPLTYLYKLEFGSSGLSGNIFKMYLGALDNFDYFYKTKKIGFFVYISLYIFRTLKLFRQFIITKIKRI